MSHIYIEKSILIKSTDDYHYEVTTGDELKLVYEDNGSFQNEIYFASKEEMRAVALAMLELSKED